jgi:signal transduction histidine kinase
VARYTNLKPGPYTFEFTAYDPQAGGSGEDTIALPFFVPAKFHETLTFRFFLGGLVLVVGISLNRLWANRLRYRNERLEEAVRHRTAELLQQKNRLAETHRLLERTFRRRKKANQELKALYREKSDFLAIAAHDLRAPLVNLKGFASELRSAMELYHRSFLDCEGGLLTADRDHLAQILETDLPEALDFIDSSANQLEQLIGPILHLSRISRRPLHLQQVDAGLLVGDILESLSGVIADHGAEVSLSPLPVVTADLEALADIIHELLNNSLAFLAAGRPGRVEIFADEGEGEITIHIRDNGRGIGDAEGGRVFRLFGHAGRSNAPGRGMGLVYVRTLVHRHGGRIWYRSRPGRGTTFSFTLPTEAGSRQ